jgi:PAS domain S-box-containing protein
MIVMIQIIHAFAIITSVFLGFFVLFHNQHRAVNVLFFGFSLLMAAWLTGLAVAFYVPYIDIAEAAIRWSSFLGSFAPFMFSLMRKSISLSANTWHSVIRSSRWELLAPALAGALSFTDFYLKGVEMPSSSNQTIIPEPIYGPGIYIYAAYYAAYLVLLIFYFIKDVSKSTGLQRVEIQFLLLGSFTGILFGVTSAIIIPMITDSYNSIQFAPLSSFFLQGIIAYGIATRRIMAVAEVLRRATAYALLMAYLVTIYLGTWLLFRWGLQPLEWHNIAAHVIAALAVAFSIAPAQGRFQQVAARLFLNTHSIDATRTMQQANRIIGVIGTRDELLRQFADLVASAAGADNVSIFLKEEGLFQQKHPPCDGDPAQIEDGSPLARVLRESREPLSADYFHRHRAKPLERQAYEQMTALRASLAIGIHANEELKGILLLGPSRSGHIYSATEQSVLQVLCDQMAVGLDNADLYTQVKDSALYNDLLLDNVVTGIIAANGSGRITTCNREAHRLLAAPPGSLLQRPIGELPAPLANALRATLSNTTGVRGVETRLKLKNGEERPVRLSTAPFASHTGKQLGALLVIEDLTTIRKLEAQIRRTDRLASIGTLSAGMAHEIKNPLVTLKTFTQLLPERYQDADFRDTFSTLVGQEVRRIDSIVNQLLRFARPAKPSLQPTHIHEVLDNTLRLVHQQLKQKHIRLEREYQAANDLIQGDSDLLVQAFLNFFLNAIEAMPNGGTLTVRTHLLAVETNHLTPEGGIATETRLRVAIQDDGVGIKPEDIPHVFDPFFTTKTTGTGLGLSVSHGIIQEHRGMLDVESVLGEGSTFYIFFPVAHEEVPA